MAGRMTNAAFGETHRSAAQRRIMMLLIAPALAAHALGGVAAEQILRDPMRPPAEFVEQERSQDEGGGEPALVLQSVKIAGAHRSAVISGVTVKPGDKLGGATVTEIRDGDVVLKSGDTQQVLKLYPGVDKRAVVQPYPAGDRGPSSRASASARGGKR